MSQTMEYLRGQADRAQTVLDQRYGPRAGINGHAAGCRCPECVTARQAEFENTKQEEDPR